MAYKVTRKPSPEKLFLDELDDYDPDAPLAEGETAPERTFVVIRAADGNDEMLLQEVTTGSEYLYEVEDIGKVREYRPKSLYLSDARKTFLTLVECNITDEEGNVLFTKGMAWVQFLENWAKLDEYARQSIMARVIRVNRHWANF